MYRKLCIAQYVHKRMYGKVSTEKIYKEGMYRKICAERYVPKAIYRKVSIEWYGQERYVPEKYIQEIYVHTFFLGKVCSLQNT